MCVRPAKTQISLGIRQVWSESSLCAQWVAKDPRFLHADSEDSDQTGRMPKLIWVFAGPHCWLCHDVAHIISFWSFCIKGLTMGCFEYACIIMPAGMSRVAFITAHEQIEYNRIWHIFIYLAWFPASKRISFSEHNLSTLQLMLSTCEETLKSIPVLHHEAEYNFSTFWVLFRIWSIA